MPVLSGKSHWASITSPNKTFEPHKWMIDLSLEGEELEKAKKIGLSIKNKGDERGDFVPLLARSIAKMEVRIVHRAW